MRRPLIRMMALLAIMAFVAAGCEDQTKVGEGLRSFDPKEAEAQKRLGEFTKQSPSPAATSNPNALGGKSPTADPNAEANKNAPVVEIVLVHDDPYFTVDGQPTNEVTVQAGSKVRIVNKDDRRRSFTTTEPVIDSGPLDPGQTWESAVLNRKGSFHLEDKFVPFITALFRVS